MIKYLFLFIFAAAMFNFTPNADSDVSPTYTKDIKPIFKARCAMCHDNMGSEKNWQDYDAAYAKRDLIKKRVFTERTMPAAGMPMDDAERKEIADWVDSGAKK